MIGQHLKSHRPHHQRSRSQIAEIDLAPSDSEVEECSPFAVGNSKSCMTTEDYLDVDIAELWIEVCTLTNSDAAAKTARPIFKLNRPPKRFRDWFNDGLIKELMSDIDKPNVEGMVRARPHGCPGQGIGERNYFCCCKETPRRIPEKKFEFE